MGNVGSCDSMMIKSPLDAGSRWCRRRGHIGKRIVDRTAIMCDKQVIRDIIEWDAGSWRRALPFGRQHAGDLKGMKVLDIGGRNGGLSLCFALAGCTVVCSDLDGPAEAAGRTVIEEEFDIRKTSRQLRDLFAPVIAG